VPRECAQNRSPHTGFSASLAANVVMGSRAHVSCSRSGITVPRCRSGPEKAGATARGDRRLSVFRAGSLSLPTAQNRWATPAAVTESSPCGETLVIQRQVPTNRRPGKQKTREICATQRVRIFALQNGPSDETEMIQKTASRIGRAQMSAHPLFPTFQCDLVIPIVRDG
jgi:hypothetical protein